METDKEHYWETQFALKFPESAINFNPQRPLAAVSRSRDFKQINETEIAHKRLDLQNIQGNTIGKPGTGFQNQS